MSPHNPAENRIRLALAAADQPGSSIMFENFPFGLVSRSFTLVEFPKVLLPSFDPVLRALQSMQMSGDLPFSKILAPPMVPTTLHEIKLPAYTRKHGFRFRLNSILDGAELYLDPKEPFDLANFQDQTSLDNAQAQAVVAALTRQLALIQGPPGTEKSYCGVQLIKILLDNNRRDCMLGPILIVCFTNHALDQLLEHLLDAGIEQVIRIGSRSKSERLQAVSLNKVTLEQGERTKVEKSTIWELGQELEELKTRLEVIIEEIAAANEWDSVKNLAEISFPGLIGKIDGLPDDDGFQIVQKKSSPQQRFQQWLRASHGPISVHRQAAYLTWIEKVKEPLLQRFTKLQDAFTETQKQVKRQRLGERLRILQQANIVGVTSSGLARHLDLLRNLESKVIVIEEAGELLEAHTLTSLLPSIEHAILIGDHLQLRPHLLNHDLSCESGQGTQYSFDVSLFERLVNPAEGIRANKVPFSTLETLRRMHPSISTLIRDELYPSLQDFPTVLQYPQVHGIRHRLFWIDHKEPEADADEHLSTSHYNMYEVEMTLALVSHLIKQGQYKSPERIAVITP